MATHSITVPDDGWTELGTGLVACVMNPSGDMTVYVGDTVPEDSDRTGFPVKSGDFVGIPFLQELGGGVWVRSDHNIGGIVYASA